MKVLVESVGGDGLALGLALEREGHEARISISKAECARAGDGLLEKVTDPVSYAREEADLVIYDQIGNGAVADLLRNDGVRVLGAGRALDQLELDRLHATRVARALGLHVPETQEFPDGDFTEAIRWLEKHPGKYVYKGNNQAAADKTVAYETEEMHEYLEHEAENSKTDQAGRTGFILQAFIEGAEVSCERWYAQGTPVPALDNATIEAKKFLAGDLGPAVGCMGNVVTPAPPALVQQTVAHLDRFAAAHAVTGPIDINSIIDRRTRRVYWLEFSPRLGYDAVWAWAARLAVPLGDLFDALADGHVPAVRWKPGVGVAIRVSVPPYPHGNPAEARGLPIVDDILDDPNIWVGDVMRDEDTDKLVIAGADAVAYVVTAVGPTAREAYTEAYRWLAESRLMDRQYRSDLIAYTQERLGRLQAVGMPIRA